MECDHKLNCKGLSCPLPILKLSKAMKGVKVGETLELISTDPGAVDDVPKWCKKSSNKLLKVSEVDGIYHFVVEKK